MVDCKEKRRRESNMVDVEKVLKTTIKKGKVKVGTKQTKMVAKDGSAKLIVMANNCQNSSEISKLAGKKNIPIYNYLIWDMPVVKPLLFLYLL